MQRFGRTHRPFYRIGAIDQRERRNGNVLENLGWYDPSAKDSDKQIHLKEERIKHWLSVGAQPSDTVRDMLGNRDLLPEKMKAKWESDREKARLRVSCKTAVARAEKASKELTEFAESASADVAGLVEIGTQSVESAKNAFAKADVKTAESAADAAEKALADAKAAEEQAKKAAEEAAAAEAVAASAEAPAEEAAEG